MTKYLFEQENFPEPWDVTFQSDEPVHIDHPNGLRIAVDHEDYIVTMILRTDDDSRHLFGHKADRIERAAHLAQALASLHNYLEVIHKQKGREKLVEKVLAEVDDDEAESVS